MFLLGKSRVKLMIVMVMGMAVNVASLNNERER